MWNSLNAEPGRGGRAERSGDGALAFAGARWRQTVRPRANRKPKRRRHLVLPPHSIGVAGHAFVDGSHPAGADALHPDFIRASFSFPLIMY